MIDGIESHRLCRWTNDREAFLGGGPPAEPGALMNDEL